MTRKIAASCLAAMFGLAVSAGAQTPPQQPTQPPTSPYPAQERAEKHKDMKLSGCVQAGTEAGAFELTNVKKSHNMASSSSTSEPSSATSGMASTSGDKKTVKLSAGSGVDLAAHVGHTVEVMGSWNKAASDMSSAPSASSPSAADAMSAAGREFKVSNVKMLSSTCSAGTN